MREYVVNARFVGMRITGVQRTAYEIVSRLLLNDQVHYNLVAPKLKSDVIATLPVKQQGRIRQGHLWEQLELPRIVRGAGRDAVLYSPMTSGPLAVTRQVMTVHDLFPLEHPEWFSRAFSTWYRWLLPRMIRRVVRIVVNSRYTRDQLLERYVFANDKVVLCPFAQSARFATTSTEKVAQFRTDQGLPERYLLSLGSIQPRKNLATLAAAWRRTSASKQGIKLVLAGGVAPKRVLNVASTETNILEHPTIYHTGFFSD